MFQIRYVENTDKDFWYTLDRHLPEAEFTEKVADKRGYVHKPIGIFRYHMFWDNTPFLSLIYIDFSCHNKGYGRKATEFWENVMRGQGYKLIVQSNFL